MKTYAMLTGSTLVIRGVVEGETVVINANIDSAETKAEVTAMIEGQRLDELLKMFLPDEVALKTRINTDLFEEREGSLYMKGINVSIPKVLAKRLAVDNDEALINFWRLCALNPDPAARDNLFWFLDKHNFEILDNGCFLVHRNVDTTSDKDVYTDRHTKTMRIRMGEVVSLSRESCDSNQNNTCSSGLHVASKDWLSTQGAGYFGSVRVVAMVNPMHVVAVPPKDSYGKMRVCEYMPVTVYSNYDTETKRINPLIEKTAEVMSKIISQQIKNLDVSAAQDGSKKRLFNFTNTSDLRKALGEASKALSTKVVR